jgi:hypothetical protein
VVYPILPRILLKQIGLVKFQDAEKRASRACQGSEAGMSLKTGHLNDKSQYIT